MPDNKFRTVLPKPDETTIQRVVELHAFATKYKLEREASVQERLIEAMKKRDLDGIRKQSKLLREIINTPAPALLWRDVNLCTWSR